MKFLPPLISSSNLANKTSFRRRRQDYHLRKEANNASSIAADDLRHHATTINKKNDHSKHSEEVCLLQLLEFCRLFCINLTKIQIFRYACCHDFQYESARKAIEGTYDSPYLHLRMDGALIETFQKRIIMPLPGLRTRDNSQVIYMRASRYHHHSATSKQLAIDSLCYLLNDMSRTRDDCRGGVSIIANLRSYGVKNFDMDAILQAAKAVEGRLLVPARFTVLLYIDAPEVFVNGWKLLRPMLAPWLAKKVHFIKADQLGNFLVSGYKDFLPDEIEGGWKDTRELVDDYVDLKIYDERM